MICACLRITRAMTLSPEALHRASKRPFFWPSPGFGSSAAGASHPWSPTMSWFGERQGVLYITQAFYQEGMGHCCCRGSHSVCSLLMYNTSTTDINDFLQAHVLLWQLC